jgi:predicted ester cyclase
MAGQVTAPGAGVSGHEVKRGGAMTSNCVETYRAGHQAFNRRDFEAMTEHYADSITWTDHPQSRTFRTPQEFKDDFLTGWVGASSDIRITGPCYFDAGRTVVCAFTVVGTHDGPLGPLPGTGREFALSLCEMWHFDSRGRVVGGDLYYDQVSLLMQLGLMPQPSGA